MGIYKLVKSKIFKNLFSLLICLITIYLVIFVMYISNTYYTNKFWNNLDGLKVYSLSNEILDKYEQNIKKELSQMNQRSNMQKAYYTLGVIQRFRGDYVEANNYYYQALSVNLSPNSDFLTLLYGQLAINYLSLSQPNKAEQYFQKAIEKANSNELKLKIYQQYIEGLLFSTDDYHLVRDLLEFSQSMIRTDYDKIKNFILISDVNMMIGDYKEGIRLLIEAFELSIKNEDLSMQKEIGLRLSTLNYLGGNYIQVIEILEANIFEFDYNNMISYIKSFANSVQYVKGYTSAVSFLDLYIDKFNELNLKGINWANVYFMLLKADMALKNDNLRLGQEYLVQAYERYQQVEDENLLLWFEKLYIDTLILEGTESEKIIEKNIELYNRIENSSIFYYTKLDLLDEIALQNTMLGDYKLGYENLSIRKDKFNKINEKEEFINLEKIYIETKLILKQNKFKMIKNNILITCCLMGGSFILLYYIRKKHR